MAPVLTLQMVGIRAGERLVADGLSLELRDRQVALLRGPSGSGKSTILEAVAGFHPRTAGNIAVCGIPVVPASIQAVRRKLVWLPQEPPITQANARELFASVGAQAIHAGLDLEARGRRGLVQLGLPPGIWEQAFEQLSGGEKRRVYLALALALERPLLLLDEPTAGLDDAAAALVRAAVLERTQGAALICTHDASWTPHAQTVVEVPAL